LTAYIIPVAIAAVARVPVFAGGELGVRGGHGN
jgi:hypothetical protein